MGDSCCLNIRCRREDAEKVSQTLFECDGVVPDGNGGIGETSEDRFRETDDPNVVEFEIEQANYALQDDRECLAKAGVAFMGSHGNGDSYDGGMFVAIDGELIDIQCLMEGGPAVEVDLTTGKVDADQLLNVQNYMAAVKRVEWYFQRPKRREVPDDQTAE